MSTITPKPRLTRRVTGHEINALNSSIYISSDEPDTENGNAAHEYCMDAGDVTNGLSVSAGMIVFQHGPVQEKGINGTTNEALLAIVADRLRGFQSSPYSCRENALALTKIEEAMHWLHHRRPSRASCWVADLASSLLVVEC